MIECKLLEDYQNRISNYSKKETISLSDLISQFEGTKVIVENIQCCEVYILAYFRLAGYDTVKKFLDNLDCSNLFEVVNK